jgi:site-specific DNA-methyltransferase (adenine-specific)
MAVNIEDAGFEIRDLIGYLYSTDNAFQRLFHSLDLDQRKLFQMALGNENLFGYLYGSGFPKSLDISKSIDKKEGVIHPKNTPLSENNSMSGANYTRNKMEVQSDEAKQWAGFGTALKPAMELWTLARKPLKGTVAENVLKYGTGGINIDGCRVGTEEIGGGTMPDLNQKSGVQGIYNGTKINAERKDYESHIGRFPANFIHDGSDEVVALFNDNGSAARFFYTAKANKTERNMGLYDFEEERHADRNKDDGVGGDNPRNRTNNPRKNFHPTVKPLDLMRYLCRLITPPNGIVLDPYLGSGTTAVAAKLEGFQYIGIEMEADYCKIAEARVANCDQDYNKIDDLLSQPGVVEVPTIFDFISQ